ncbi:MAG: MerR family transcriptional regulator [Acidimicrobiales bacterium]
MSGDSLYGIGAVAKMLGVAQQTLRTWEDRYGQVTPERTPGGQRLYSRDQVDQLLFVVQAIARGAQPADAHRLLAERSRRPMDTQGDLDPICRRRCYRPADPRARTAQPGRDRPADIGR